MNVTKNKSGTEIEGETNELLSLVAQFRAAHHADPDAQKTVYSMLGTIATNHPEVTGASHAFGVLLMEQGDFKNARNFLLAAFNTDADNQEFRRSLRLCEEALVIQYPTNASKPALLTN